ncbi:hypothetical protein ACWCQW_43690 [Streptomyces mirabilis]
MKGVRGELCPAALLGDPQLMERLVADLVDDAVRHNRQDGAGS